VHLCALAADDGELLTGKSVIGHKNLFPLRAWRIKAGNRDAREFEKAMRMLKKAKACNAA
jgi:hypothetical protein